VQVWAAWRCEPQGLPHLADGEVLRQLPGCNITLMRPGG